MRRVEQFEVGFAHARYLAVQIERDDPGAGGVNGDAPALSFRAPLAATLEELRRRVAVQPGVADVTFVERLPTTTHPQKIIDMGYDVDGGASPSADGSTAGLSFRQATIAAVDPSYFDAVGAPILAGRGFTSADAVPSARVAIVDLGFVDQILQGRNAVGQQVRFRFPGPTLRPWAPGTTDGPAPPGDWYHVIGVVRELGVGADAARARRRLLPARHAGTVRPDSHDDPRPQR